MLNLIEFNIFITAIIIVIIIITYCLIRIEDVKHVTYCITKSSIHLSTLKGLFHLAVVHSS